MTEWIEIEPINGARTWALAVDGKILDTDDADVDNPADFLEAD